MAYDDLSKEEKEYIRLGEQIRRAQEHEKKDRMKRRIFYVVYGIICAALGGLIIYNLTCSNK